MSELHPGKVVTVQSGKHAGQAAEVKRIHEKTVEVMILGEVVRLKKGVLCGES